MKIENIDANEARKALEEIIEKDRAELKILEYGRTYIQEHDGPFAKIARRALEAQGGEREAVAWLAEGPGWKRVFLDREAADNLVKGEWGASVSPLYTRPAEQAVTEEWREIALVLEYYITGAQDGLSKVPVGTLSRIATALEAQAAELAILRQNEKDYEMAYGAGVQWKERAERAEAQLAEARKALGAALAGLDAGCNQYAVRTMNDVEIPGGDQLPWVRLMQIGRDAARRVLTGGKKDG